MAAYDIVQACGFHQGLGGDWNPSVAPSLQFLASVSQTAESSGRTAGDLAVIHIAEPSAAQDFRGERDVDR
jgi:hypothetical protein